MDTPRSLGADISRIRRTFRTTLLALVACACATRLGAQGRPAGSAVDGLARGEAFLTAGQYRSALTEFETLQRANPADPAPLLGLGNAQEGLGRTRAAEKAYQEYIARRPTDASGYVNLGRVLAATRREEQALQAFRSAQRLSPKSAAATRGAGLTLHALGRREEALRALRDASRLDGADPTTWGAMALVALELDRGADAAGYWEAALHRDPGYFDQRPAERKKWEKLMVTVGPRPAPDEVEAPLPAAPAAPSRVAKLSDRAAETRGPAALGRPTDDGLSNAFGNGSSSSGSGFVVSRERGYVLTNKHVVRGCTDVKVRISGSESRPATVRALDADDDLALVETTLPNGAVASFRDDPAVRPGDVVVAVGYPLSGLLADQVNVSTGSVNALAGLYNDLHVLQMSAPVQPGSSGGALFDASGNVVGVVVTKLNAKLVADETGDIPQNVNFAVKAAIARQFLRAQGVSIRSAPSTTRRSNADVGEIGRQVTVLVECWK
jgi:tetratricopeptide (TPR) repeat protein